MRGVAIQCSRCGKTSRLVKSWEEKIETRMGMTTIKHEQYVCPDNECQKIIEKQLALKHAQSVERDRSYQERLKKRGIGKVATA